jgi:hypothetical protein
MPAVGALQPSPAGDDSAVLAAGALQSASASPTVKSPWRMAPARARPTGAAPPTSVPVCCGAARRPVDLRLRLPDDHEEPPVHGPSTRPAGRRSTPVPVYRGSVPEACSVDGCHLLRLLLCHAAATLRELLSAHIDSMYTLVSFVSPPRATQRASADLIGKAHILSAL